jgi:hypothetical protein
LLQRARYDAMVALKGKRAAKKATEKKKRKITEAEKKFRPFRERFKGEKPPLATDSPTKVRTGKRRRTSSRNHS